VRRAALLLAAGAALAHDVKHPRAEGLRLSQAALQLRVDYEVGAGERAQALRLAFDRDRDGRLDPAEQQGLAEELARMATLRTRLVVDDQPLQLERVSVRGERLDDPGGSTALLAVRVILRGSWPQTSGDWLGRHRVELRDDDESGHVPVAVECEGVSVSDSTSGVADGDFIRGATTSPGAPLILKVRR
jgi:hypothetical protein